MNHSPVLMNAYRYVLGILQPIRHYSYHNIGHTLDVFWRAEELWKAEKIHEEELEDLLLATLFHDTGFIEEYERNEVIGARIARGWLESEWHPEHRILRVEQLIMATVLFSKTNNLLEKIIQDADLDNFWRDDCFYKTLQVENERREIWKLDTKTIDTIFWKLFHGIKFQTPTWIRERRVKLAENVARFEIVYHEIMWTQGDSIPSRI
jgi:HD superfamily phosphodiesterase